MKQQFIDYIRRLDIFCEKIDADFSDPAFAYDYNEVQELYFDETQNNFVFLAGECGLRKKDMLARICKDLLLRGIEKEDILYLNYELPILHGEDVVQLISDFYSARAASEALYLIINEIQECGDWFATVTEVRNKYPKIKLKLAGNINVGNKLLDGYSVFLNNLIKKNGLEENVVYLGSLDENQIISHLQEANACVIPSFIETYCLAFAESMIVGTPTIASFAGAMPELAENGKEALFYNSVDYYTCAALIDKVLQDEELAERLSMNGRQRRMRENNMEAVVKTQLEIYENVLSNERYI